MRLPVLALLLLGSCKAEKGDSTPPEDTDTGLPPITGCAPPGTDAPNDVFCTGLYATRDPAYHVAAALDYQPGVLLWSDGADKGRYLLLPPGGVIDTHDWDHWVFPVDTKIFKEFRLDNVLVETRMLWKQSDTNWITTTYIWDATGMAATRNKSLTGIILDSGYEIPTDKDCGKCHHGGSDYALGVEAVALGLPTAKGHTLTELVNAGLLSDPPVDTVVNLPEDNTGKAAASLGFLHANCGMPCHSSRGLGDETQLLLRLRGDELWDETGHARNLAVSDTDTWNATVNVPPTTASVAQEYPGALRILPGNHEQSVVWLLSELRGTYQMPPLASHQIDEVDNAELASWIDALSP